MAQLATAAYLLMIAGLFWLDRDQRAHTSGALWLPIVWVFLACSRSVNQWLFDVGHPTAVANSADQQFLMEGNPVDRAVFGLLIVLGIIVLIHRRTRIGRILRANTAILLFFAYCAVSLLWSDYPDVAFKRWIKGVGDLVMLLVVLSDRQPVAAVKKFLASAGFVLVPLSVLFIKYIPDLGRGYGRWDYRAFYTGVTLNKNSLGVLCLFFGLASVWRLLIVYNERKQGLRVRWLAAHSAILAMVLWMFWIANSMTSVSCFLIGVVLLLAANFRTVIRRPTFVHVLVVIMILGSVATLFFGIGSDFVKDTMARDTSTLTDRTNVWKLAMSISANPLVGTGFESFWLGTRLEKMWRVFSWEPTEAHDGYLEVYLNLGWIGVGLLAVVIVAGYRRVIRAYRRRLPLSNLWLAFFVVGIIYNFTEAAFFRMLTPAWIFFLLAITDMPEIANLKAERSRHKVIIPSALPTLKREQPAMIMTERII